MREQARAGAATLVVFLAIAAVFAGCTPSKKSEAAAQLQAKIAACDLFTAEEAVNVSHESVARMTSTLEDASKPDLAQCVYNSGTLDEPRILSLQVRTFNDATSAARVEADSRKPLARLAGRPTVLIGGIGDGAVWAGGKVQQLYVRRGPVQLIVTVNSPDGSEQLAEARTIAVRALARLDLILQEHQKAAAAPKPAA